MNQVSLPRRCSGFLLWAALASASAGCGGPPGDAVTPTDGESRVASTENDVRETIHTAQQALVDRLMERLLEAMSEGGVSAAITVCKSDAPVIAKSVGQQYGVRIGRTSFRLRNPENAPPDWAQSLIERRVDEPQYVDLDNGDLAALLPIRLQPQCMVCHGPEDQLAEEVKQSLADQYPDDEATDFHAGDLRGWFWIEASRGGSSRTPKP